MRSDDSRTRPSYLRNTQVVGVPLTLAQVTELRIALWDAAQHVRERNLEATAESFDNLRMELAAWAEAQPLEQAYLWAIDGPAHAEHDGDNYDAGCTRCTNPDPMA